MYVYICEAVRVWLYSNVSCFNYVYNIKRKKKKQNKNQSIIMSLDTDIDQVSPSSTSSSLRRHFLIVPLFNPERRHSWDNAVSNPSQRNNTAISAITVTTTADSTMRWEFFHLWHIIVGVCRHAFDVWERNEGEGKIREKYRKKKREKEWDERIVNAKFKGKLSVTTFCVCMCVCVCARALIRVLLSFRFYHSLWAFIYIYAYIYDVIEDTRQNVQFTFFYHICFYLDILIMDFYRRFLSLPLTERRHSVGPTLTGKRVR